MKFLSFMLNFNISLKRFPLMICFYTVLILIIINYLIVIGRANLSQHRWILLSYYYHYYFVTKILFFFF